MNFENKADLARFIATRLFAWRIEELDGLAEGGAVRTPAELMRPLLASMFDENRPPLPVILQFWSEALVDPDCTTCWPSRSTHSAAASNAHCGRGPTDAAPGRERRWPSRVAQTCLIMGQGFLANRGLFGWMGAEQYLDAVLAAFGPASLGVSAKG